MAVLAWILFGLGLTVVLSWLYEVTFGVELDELDDTLSSNRVETMLCELNQSPPEMNRQDILSQMSWIWQETRVLALACRSPFTSLFLIVLGLLFALVWIKTWVRPSVEDLRLLLGSELFMLCQVRKHS